MKWNFVSHFGPHTRLDYGRLLLTAFKVMKDQNGFKTIHTLSASGLFSSAAQKMAVFSYLSMAVISAFFVNRISMVELCPALAARSNGVKLSLSLASILAPLGKKGDTICDPASQNHQNVAQFYLVLGFNKGALGQHGFFLNTPCYKYQ